MTRLRIVTLLILSTIFGFSNGLRAQDKKNTDEIVYYDLADFPRLGQAVDVSRLENIYDRLPFELKDSIRQELWNLGKNSAGIAIRFRSDAKRLKARWDVINNFWMNHMTPTGIKGLDVYAYDNGRWVFVGSGRPGHQKDTFVSNIISNMDGSMREYMMFLPLYDGVTKVEIGVNEGAVVEKPQLAYPVTEKPIVVYGTSVTQGGCATRPGMIYTSIMMRDMNREFINLGFSGNARLDYEIADIMADTDAALFVLDNMANCTVDRLDRLEGFVEILRAKNPTTPILLLDEGHHTYKRFDLKTRKDVDEKNARLQEIYSQLSKNDPNIYLIPADEMIGFDEEGTVDGDHFTDLGFLRMAQKLQPAIERVLQ